MLGEQLLKNERVALVELIKNSYDADASRVDVFFQGIRYRHDQYARITDRGTDDGCGMTLETVQRAWMNPATPTKFLAKRKGQRRTTEKRRGGSG